MNRITYGDCTFTDSTIVSAKVALANAMISETLSADELRFTAHAYDDGYLRTVMRDMYKTVNNEGYKVRGNRPESFIYGTPVDYYKDDEHQGTFYLSEGRRIGRDLYEFVCVSAIGLLIKIPHVGGVYESAETTVGDIVRPIFDTIGFTEGTDYTIEEAVAEIPVNGWLPYSNCRDNLQNVLFAVGASIVKSDDGNYLTIKFISSPTLAVVPDARIYQGGEVRYLSPTSRVEVWEHEYHAFLTDEEVILYEKVDTEVENELIIFDEPCHNLTTTGTLTYSEYGANYAIISGVGRLLGKKHTHTTNVITEVITNNDQNNVVEVKDATLVSPLNSKTVAKRVANYYAQAKEVECGIALAQDGLKPASLVTFTNPFGEEDRGYVKSMDITISGLNKSETVIATDWTPKYFGNYYGESYQIAESGAWVSPITGHAKIIICGGGQGGQGGKKGADGSDGETVRNTLLQPPTLVHALSGFPGEAGDGGQGGRVYVFEADLVEGQSYQVNIGQGGQGGARNGGAGSYGTETTIVIDGVTYSSASGERLLNGYVDAFTGEVYGGPGWRGIPGQKRNESLSSFISTELEPVQVQISRSKYKTFYYQACSPSNVTIAPLITLAGVRAGGADGGTGAFCYPMADRSISLDPLVIFIPSIWIAAGGAGGDGADAVSLEDWINSQYNTEHILYDPGIGCGGAGGNGGGGGAGGGNIIKPTIYLGNDALVPGSGGDGGNGSRGCRGGNGGILIYV